MKGLCSKVSLEGETVDMVAPIVTHQKASGILGSLLARMSKPCRPSRHGWETCRMVCVEQSELRLQ